MTAAPLPWDHLCSADQVLDLHARALREHGGPPGLRDPGCPEATLGAAWHKVQYSEAQEEEETLCFAVYVLHYFATKQCFADGNKRVAWASFCAVLARIGLEVQATDEEAAEMVDLVAMNQLKSVDTLMNWVTERLVELRPNPSVASRESA